MVTRQTEVKKPYFVVTEINLHEIKSTDLSANCMVGNWILLVCSMFLLQEITKKYISTEWTDNTDIYTQWYLIIEFYHLFQFSINKFLIKN